MEELGAYWVLELKKVKMNDVSGNSTKDGLKAFICCLLSHTNIPLVLSIMKARNTPILFLSKKSFWSLKMAGLVKSIPENNEIIKKSLNVASISHILVPAITYIC